MQEIQETYFLTDSSIIFPEYSSNIIKGSKELLQENSDISLIFTPNLNYENINLQNSFMFNLYSIGMIYFILLFCIILFSLQNNFHNGIKIAFILFSVSIASIEDLLPIHGLYLSLMFTMEQNENK